MLKSIKDKRVKENISNRIDNLATDPDKQGKPLSDELIGYRSLRVVGQRYRIIYRVEKKKVIVVIVAVGIRKKGSKKDVYTLAKKLFRIRLID